MDKHHAHDNDADHGNPTVNPSQPTTDPDTDKLGDEFIVFADETLAWAEAALALPFFCVYCETTHTFGLCPADIWD